MAAAQPQNEPGGTLSGGSFYGAIRRRHEQYGAIFTDLQHSSPRRLPAHAHELPFFALLLDGSYGERYGRQNAQYGPLTVMYRPAGIPHQDEIGPRGVKFFEIEIRPSWRERIGDCSGSLDIAHDDCAGGPFLWLALKLYRETRGEQGSYDLCVESLLAELLAQAACLPRERFHDSPPWLARVVERVQIEYSRRLTLDELGNEAGVHPVHLSRVFRKCKGEGIGDFVHRLRVRAACEQMLRRDRTLADIGFSTGFADQSHFTRAFRKVTGMSPAEFRKTVASG
jgi:AraC family transcriptional regulator